MIVRKLLALALIFGLSGVGLVEPGQAQDAKKPAKKIQKRIVLKKDNDNEKDDDLHAKVVEQLEKALKKFEKELGDEKVEQIIKSVEQSLAGKLKHIEMKIEGLDKAKLHDHLKWVEKFSNLGENQIKPHIIQLHGDRKVIGVMLQQEGDSPIKIQKVIEGSAAEKAGIKAGDVVIKVNGKKIESAGSLSDHVQKSDGPVKLEVKREGKNITVKVVPKKVEGGQAFQGILELKDLEGLSIPKIHFAEGDQILELHGEMIKKLSSDKLKDAAGKAHKIIQVKPGDGKKKIEWKIDRAAEDKKILLDRAHNLKKHVEHEIEIKSDLTDSIEQLKKQMKELQAEIQKLKNSKK